MKRRITQKSGSVSCVVSCVVLLLALVPFGAGAESPALPASATEVHGSPDSGVVLSPALTELLIQEMIEIQDAMVRLVPAIATGDWETVTALGEGIEASFVLKRSLTPELRQEIGGLPAEFRRLDRRFHATGGALARAANSGDAELVVFYSSRLLESCTACHGRFAEARFPGLK